MEPFYGQELLPLVNSATARSLLLLAGLWLMVLLTRLARREAEGMSRYSAIVMDHFQSPRNRGRMAEADAVGVDGTPGRGRYFIVYLKLTGQLIVDTLFECNGCGVTIATGSVLTEMIKNKSLVECQAMTVQTLLLEMDGLPADKGYCAQFAMAALQDAVRHGLPERH